VSQALTRLFLEVPVLGGLLWVVLHGADWALTIHGARLRAELLKRTGTTPRSDYELNPVFRADVATLRFGSRRFLVTWLAGAVLFTLFPWFCARASPAPPAITEWLTGAVFGMLVFTRLDVLGRHVRNIHVFGAMLRSLDAGQAVSLPQLTMRTNLLASAVLYANAIAVLGFAAALTGDPWLVGGVFGLMLLGGKHLLLGLATR
jgi:hypothetical protein